MKNLLAFCNKDMKKLVGFFLRNLNWQALSVIVAMFLFAAQIGYNIIDKRMDKSEQVYKIRTIVLSEIENNLFAVSSGGYESPSLDDGEICAPLPDDDLEAAKRIAVVVSYLHDDVYFSQLDKLSSLPGDELKEIVKTYNSIARLKNLSLQLEFPVDQKGHKIRLLRKEYNKLYSLLSSIHSSLVFSAKDY